MSFQLIFLPCVSLGEFLFMPSYSPSEEWWCQARWIVGSWHPFCLPSPQQWILQTHTCAQMTLPPLGFRGPESPQNLQPLGLGPSAWWLWSRGHSLTPPCWWCVVTGTPSFSVTLPAPSPLRACYSLNIQSWAVLPCLPCPLYLRK